jgi:ribonucleoside-diphosphate reductase alpha chain
VQERTEALDGPPANGGNGVNIIKSETKTEEQPGSTADLVPTLDAPLCSNCGTRMRPAGSCFACESCGSTSGCS